MLVQLGNHGADRCDQPRLFCQEQYSQSSCNVDALGFRHFAPETVIYDDEATGMLQCQSKHAGFPFPEIRYEFQKRGDTDVLNDEPLEGGYVWNAQT